MPETFADILPPEVKAQYPLGGLQPDKAAWLSQPVPDSWTPANRDFVGKDLATRIPKWADPVRMSVERVRQAQVVTPAMRSEAHQQAAASLSAARYAGYQRAPKPVQYVEQALAGVEDAAPSLAPFVKGSPLDVVGPKVSDTVPAPSGMPERLARTAGGVTAFGLEAVPVSALGGGAAATAAIPAMSQEGGVGQRLTRGAAMAIAGGGAARLEPLVGAIPGLGGEAAKIALPAVAFGPVESGLEWGMQKPLGLNPPDLTWGKAGTSAVDLAIVGIVHHAVGGLRGNAKAPVEAPTEAAQPVRMGEPTPTPPSPTSPTAEAARAAMGERSEISHPYLRGAMKSRMAMVTDAAKRDAIVESIDRDVVPGFTGKTTLEEARAHVAKAEGIYYQMSGRQPSKTGLSAGATARISDAKSADLSQTLVGRTVSYADEFGQQHAGAVQAAEVHPDGSVLIHVEGDSQPIRFNSVAEFTGRAVSPTAQPQEVLPAEGNARPEKVGRVAASEESPAPEKPAPTPRLRQVLEGMQVSSEGRAAKLADGLNSRQPDLEARVVKQRGGKFGIEVNADAQAPPNPVPAPGAAAPKPAERAAAPVAGAENPLTRDLAGAKPRYSYGPKQFELSFESDNDRAAFIASQEKKSKRDADYRKHLTDQGFSDEQIAEMGKRVRDHIKGLAREGDPENGPLRIVAVRHEQAPTPEGASAQPAEPQTLAPSEAAPSTSSDALPANPWQEHRDSGRFASPEHERAVRADFDKFTAAVGEGHGVTPAQWIDHAGHARRSLDALETASKGVTEEAKNLPPEQAKPLLEQVRSDLKAARAFNAKTVKMAVDAVKQAKAAGTSIPNALYEVHKRLMKERPPSPADWGGTMSFGGTGEIGKYIGHLVMGGIPRAVDAVKRGAGKALSIRVGDSHGNVQARFEVDPGTPDYMQSAPLSAGLLQRLHAGGITAFMPDEIARRLTVAPVNEHLLAARMTDMFRIAVGDKAWSELRSGHPVSELLKTAAESGKSDQLLSPRNQQTLEAIRSTFRELLDLVNEHRGEMGQGPLIGLKDYSGPNLIEGEFSTGIDRAIQRLLGRIPGEAEAGDIKDRFFEHRQGAKDFTPDMGSSLEAWIRAATRLMAHEGVVRDAADAMLSLHPSDPQRIAGLEWLKNHYFPRKSEFEKRTDRGISAIFASHRSGDGIIDLSRHEAELRGVNLDLVKQSEKVKWVAKGVDAQIPPAWRKVGEAHGGDLYAGSKGEPHIEHDPELRGVFQLMVDAKRELGLKANAALSKMEGREFDLPLERKIALFRERQAILRFKGSPFKAWLRAMGKGNLYSMVGYNPHTLALHTWQLMATTVPEYMARDVMDVARGRMPRSAANVAEGTLRWGKAGAVRGARNVVNLAERNAWLRRYLTPEQFDAARKALPLSPFELVGQAAGSRGSIIEDMGRSTHHFVGEAKPSMLRQVLHLISPLGPLHATVSTVRGLDACIHVVAGMREGLDPGTIAEQWAWSRENEAKMIQRLANEGIDGRTAMSNLVNQWPRTMMDYSLGRGAYMNGTVRRLLTQFSLFVKEYNAHWVLRPTEGALRLPQNLYRIVQGKSVNYGQMKAAATFAAQFALYGALSTITDNTQYNLLPMAAAPHVVITNALLRVMFKNSDRMKRWLSYGVKAAGHMGLPGLQGYGDPVANMISGASPSAGFGVNAIEEAGGALARIVAHPEKANENLPNMFMLRTLSAMMAAQTRLPINQMRKYVRTHWDVFKNHPAAIDMLDVRSRLDVRSPADEVAYQLGMLKEQQEKRMTHRVPKKMLGFAH